MTNSNEIFDIVDENNKVIGQEKRGIVHRKGLWHRAAGVFVFNSRGELLLQKRSKNADINPGLLSTSSAGHLGTEKDYLKAARRELKEELGIELPLEEIGELKIEPPNDKTFIKLFSGRHDGKFKIQKEELAGIKFFPVGKIKEMIDKSPWRFSPNFMALFNFYLGKTEGKK